MELHSQQVRALAPESDPLKIGMGWTIDDLSKPQIMVESTFGDSHPGSAHLDQFVRQAVQAVNEHGGKAARYFATDLCDGIAQDTTASITPSPTVKPSSIWWRRRRTQADLTAAYSSQAATRPFPPC